MGKAGAYLTYKRKDHTERPCKKTVKDFEEFAIPLTRKEQQIQASRCMMCGVAFCQSGISFGKARTSGCPLHNLIPEWNDLYYRGLMSDAAERLALTNPFPEFTGRVCPALCEAACNLAYVDEATTIRDNERAISDEEWAAGGPQQLSKPKKDAPRVAVIGSGPAGLAVAWGVLQAGLQADIIERADRAGGLLMYGIPNMKLPKDIVQRRVDLLTKCGIGIKLNTDASDKRVANRLLKNYDALVVAVGAGTPRPLSVPGHDARGVYFAVEYLRENTKALLGKTKPVISAKGLHVVVIGGGDTGTDCVATAIRQGAKSVRQFEFTPEPPKTPLPSNGWPEWQNILKTDYGQREAIAVFGKDPREWAIDTKELIADENGTVCELRAVRLDWSGGGPVPIKGSEFSVDAQLVLIACGFTGPDRSVFDTLGVTLSKSPRIFPVLAKPGTHLTKACGTTPIYVAGDARSGSSLVVNALADGLACAREVACDLTG